MTARNHEPQALRIDAYGGLRLNVWDYGGGELPLLLCHCTGGAGRVWDPVVAWLDPRFHVYAVDTRGHGDSAKPREAEAYAWVNAGRDLLAVREALDLSGPLRAVGHSGGAAQIAYAEWLQPGAFGPVVLIDAIIGPHHVFAGESPLAQGARRRCSVFESACQAHTRFREKPPMNVWSEEALDAYIAHAFDHRPDGTIALKCPPEVEAWHYESGGACDVFEELDRLHFEALLVTGSESHVALLVEAQLERLAHAEKRILPAGHFVPQQAPGETAELINTWFA